jgi:hypothetical protein
MSQISDAIVEGDCCGGIAETTVEAVDATRMVELLKQHRSDPGFFGLSEDGLCENCDEDPCECMIARDGVAIVEYDTRTKLTTVVASAASMEEGHALAKTLVWRKRNELGNPTSHRAVLTQVVEREKKDGWGVICGHDCVEYIVKSVEALRDAL